MERTDGSIRAFLAVELNDGVRASLAAHIECLHSRAAKVSWVPPQNLHLTLRFLGDIVPEALHDLAEDLVIGLREIECFQLRVQGIGAFPNRQKPAVIWAGLHEPPERLFKAQALTESAARSIGLDPEGRDFAPHITLGRIRGRRQGTKLFDNVERDEAFHAGEFSVRAVSLFSSELTANGAIHRKLKEFPLKWTPPSTQESPSAY